MTLIRMRWLVSLLATFALVTAGGAVLTPARADTPDMYALVDGARAANALPPLRRSGPLQAVAQAWAEQMAASQTLAHNGAYLSQIPAGWARAGENVGYAGSDQQLHDALMASPGHRENILGAYTDIGIGRAVDSRGLVWETQEFGAYDVSPGALVQPLAPPPPPPPPAAPVVEPDPPRLPASGNTLGSGESVRAGSQLDSPAGTMHLVLQSDGNLVSYSGGRPVWDTGTWAEPVKADRLVLHASGQLLLYAGDRALWWSSTSGQGPSRLVVQDDGNVVLYRTSDGAPTWSSMYGIARSVLATDQKMASPTTLRSNSGGYAVTLRGSGELVVDGPRGRTWSTGVTSPPGRHEWLIVQSDGNLVLYGDAGPVWNTGTFGQGPTALHMQSDGNLVLVRVADGRPVWSAWTGRLV